MRCCWWAGPTAHDVRWTAREIERLRLLQILSAMRRCRPRPACVIDLSGAFDRILEKKARIDHGRCRECGGAPLATATLCAGCAERHRGYSVAYRLRKGGQRRESPPKGAAAARLGLCKTCGREPPRPGRKTCGGCAAKAAVVQARYRERRAAT